MTTRQAPQPKLEYRHNDLFRPASPTGFNACVGSNGGPYDFKDYALGYFEAGSRIVSSLLSDEWMLDVLIYPLVFAYRHGIELSLKDLAVQLPMVWDEESEVELTHLLLDNWVRIKTYLIREQEFDPENTLIDQVDTILNDFLEIDQTGQVFRYPTDRSGVNHLDGNVSAINVIVFQQAMHTVYVTFEFWMDSVRVLLQNKREAHAQSILFDEVER
jgi:hypothetical protein